jgi:hypothetical protein
LPTIWFLYVWLFKPTDKAAYSGSKQISVHDFFDY